MRLLLSVVVITGACGGGGTKPPAPDPYPTPTERCDITLREPLVLPTGREPFDLAVADLDQDGHLDVVVADAADNTVSVYLGDVHGAMHTRVTYPTGAGPVAIAALDVDHDGHMDIVTSNYGDASLSILKGRGDGTLAPPDALALGDSSRALVAADVDGDGWTDLFVHVMGGVTLFHNDHGMLTPTARIGDMQGLDVWAVADVDHDGDLDIVGSSGLSNIQVFLDDGTGTYVGGPTFAIPGGNDASGIALADFDGDGVIDLAASHGGGLPTFAVVSVMLGHGDGTFDPETRYYTHDIQHMIAAGDIDGDHIPDLVTVDNWNSSLTTLLGNGDGTFKDPIMLAAGGEYGGGIVLADLDGDQHPELIVTSATANDLTVLYSHANRMPEAPVLYPVGGAPTGGTIVDLDGDGANDVVVATSMADEIPVIFGDGHGGGTTTSIPAVSPNVVATGDVTGDGIVDIVVGSTSASQVYVMAGTGNRSFTAMPAVQLAASPEAIQLADIDGDGHLDIVVAATSIVVIRSTGQGTFASPFTVAAGLDAVSLAIADLDSDGHLDIVAGALGPPAGTGSDDTPDPTSGTGSGAGMALDFSILLGTGGGAFAQPVTYPAGFGRTFVAAGDIDNDGAPDIAVTSALDDTVAIWHGDGHGAVTRGATYDAGLAPSSVMIADVTGDDAPDLVIADLGNTVDTRFELTILPNQRDGTFGPRETHTTSVHPVAALVGDLDHDAHADIAVVDQNDANGALTGTVMFLLESCRPL